MRTPLVWAVALVCGAGIARGQTWSSGYSSPVGSGYPYTQAEFFGYPATAANPPPPAVVPPTLPAQPAYPLYPPPAYPALTGPVAGPQPSRPPVLTPDEVDAMGADPGPPQVPSKNHFWFSASYAAVFIQPERLNAPLLTVGSPADAHPGAIGQPGTSVISSNTFDFPVLSGVQTDAGVFLDPDGCLALQWSGLFMSPSYIQYGFASNAAGSPLIARPIFNANSGTNAALIDSFPGRVAGSSIVDGRSSIWGTEVNLIGRLKSGARSRWDGLVGFRYLQLAEDLTVIDQLTPLVPGFLNYQLSPVNPPNSLSDMDRFTTINRFYGLQLGSLYAIERGRFCLAGWGKAGLGVTNEMVYINGSTALIQPPTGRQFSGGGVLALPSNMGQYSRNAFGFMPEGGLTLGYNVTAHIQLTLGYSFLWWSSVARPGAQLNSAVNPTQIPTTLLFGSATGPTLPRFQFAAESFWMQTVNAGLAFHF